MLSGEFVSLPLTDITITRNARVRKVVTDDAISALADSIRRLGLVHPIVVTREAVLVAGETRYEACRALGWTHIPIQWADTLNETELLTLELEENIKRTDLSWQDQCRAVFRFHKLQQTLNEKWVIEDTATAVGISARTIKDQLSVARELETGNVRVEAAPRYSVAKNIVTREKERRSADEAAKIGFVEDIAPPPTPILTADFLTWAPTYEGQPFNFLHCDFPYGIGADKFDQSSHARDGEYVDTKEHYETLIACLLEHRGRLLGESAHIMFWFSLNHYTSTLAALSSVFFVDPYPLIWFKSDNTGVNPDPQRRARRVYETAFLCSHGDRKIVHPVSNCFAASTPEGHTSEKSIPMLQHFFKLFVDQGTRLLDPTCGSGSSLLAAASMGAEQVFGLEVNDGFAEDARRSWRQQEAKLL